MSCVYLTTSNDIAMQTNNKNNNCLFQSLWNNWISYLHQKLQNKKCQLCFSKLILYSVKFNGCNFTIICTVYTVALLKLSYSSHSDAKVIISLYSSSSPLIHPSTPPPPPYYSIHSSICLSAHSSTHLCRQTPNHPEITLILTLILLETTLFHR